MVLQIFYIFGENCYYNYKANFFSLKLKTGLYLVLFVYLYCLIFLEVFLSQHFHFIYYVFILYILKFFSTKFLFGGGKELLKYFPGIVVLKKNVMRKNTSCKKLKSKQEIVHCDDNFHKINFLISQYTEEVKKHPIVLGVLVNDKANFSLVTSNLTTSKNNSIFLAKEGVFHKKTVSVYNQVLVEKIDINNIGDIQQLVEQCEYVDYTKKLSGHKASVDLNEFMIEKANEQTGERHETYLPGATFEQKTNKLVNLFEDLKQMNSRED